MKGGCSSSWHVEVKIDRIWVSKYLTPVTTCDQSCVSSEVTEMRYESLKVRYQLKKAAFKEWPLECLHLHSTVMQLSIGVFIYIKEDLNLGILSL